MREVRRSVQRLDEKMDGGLTRLDAKIDARTDELRQEMSELRQEMSELRQEMSVQFRWMVGTIVAVGGLIVAALKLLP